MAHASTRARTFRRPRHSPSPPPSSSPSPSPSSPPPISMSPPPSSFTMNPTLSAFLTPTPSPAASSSCLSSSSSASRSSKRSRDNSISSPRPCPPLSHQKRCRVDSPRPQSACFPLDRGPHSRRCSRSPDYPCSTSSSVSNLTAPSPRISSSPARAPDLPDEVLVSIFRFVDHASKLASLRTVCRQWCKVIDETPDVWRAVSFKNASFLQPVVLAPNSSSLRLGPRHGEAAVSLAARSGNEWARFLKRVIFERHPLNAITIPQPIASMLVSGDRSFDVRPFPPWEGELPPTHGDGTWIGVHAARRSMELSTPLMAEQGGGAQEDGSETAAAAAAAAALQNVHLGGNGRMGRVDVGQLPRGAMVGMIHVRFAFRGTGGGGGGSSAPGWVWQIDRAVSLRKPIRCAGFVGLWAMSAFLTDLLVNAMHSQ